MNHKKHAARARQRRARQLAKAIDRNVALAEQIRRLVAHNSTLRYRLEEASKVTAQLPIETIARDVTAQITRHLMARFLDQGADLMRVLVTEAPDLMRAGLPFSLQINTGREPATLMVQDDTSQTLYAKRADARLGPLDLHVIYDRAQLEDFREWERHEKAKRKAG